MEISHPYYVLYNCHIKIEKHKTDIKVEIYLSLFIKVTIKARQSKTIIILKLQRHQHQFK